MFRGARRRLALRYAALFMVVLVVFSAAFLGVMSVVLRPSFDLAPELPTGEAARQAYASTLATMALALAIADVAVIALVAVAAFYLAGRTLSPIQGALERQRRFVADASHDLRNPLAAIRTTAESALATNPDAVASAALRSIVESSERLTSLTTDLLLMASSERELTPEGLESMDVSVAAAEAVGQLRDLHTAVDVSLELVPGLEARADPAEVARILANLLENAVRYGEGGPIVVRSLEEDREAIVEVSDHGPGIAEADVPHLFEPFYRVRSDAAAPPGNGLGLAIAHALARRNGGRLSVTTRPGDGSTFRLHFGKAR
ncbi:MAG: HAMP domain-containing sensor histidine kinase [Candidatus Limnocylindria bacterium]